MKKNITSRARTVCRIVLLKKIPLYNYYSPFVDINVIACARAVTPHPFSKFFSTIVDRLVIRKELEQCQFPLFINILALNLRQ